MSNSSDTVSIEGLTPPAVSEDLLPSTILVMHDRAFIKRNPQAEAFYVRHADGLGKVTITRILGEQTMAGARKAANKLGYLPTHYIDMETPSGVHRLY